MLRELLSLWIVLAVGVVAAVVVRIESVVAVGIGIVAALSLSRSI